MKNPFGRRTPCGECEFPFHMELYNPETKGEVEAYATKWRPTSETMVDVTILLNEGHTEVPARVIIVNGKFEVIHFPADGMSTADWGKRRDVAAAYVLSEYRRMTKSGQVPPTPAPTTTKKKRGPLWVAPVIILVVIVLTILMVWSGGNYDKKPDEITNHPKPRTQLTLAPTPDIPPTSTQNAENAPPTNTAESSKIAKPLASARPKNLTGAGKPTGQDSSISQSTGDVTADQVMRNRACEKPVAVAHSGDLEIAACGCERQTASVIACSLFAINSGGDEKELAIKAGNTADDNVGNSVTVYHDNITCGEGGSKIILYPGIPKNCYLRYDDKSKGASKYATLHLYLRWDGNYGMMPSIGKIPIS